MCCIGVTLCTQKVLPDEKGTRGSLAHELVSDGSQNKVITLVITSANSIDIRN